MTTLERVGKIAPELADLAVDVDDLRTFARNPRRGDVAAIAESLAEHGQYRPIVARADGEVLSGNHTLLAARTLGWSHVAAVRIDVDDDAAARIVLVDNRSADLAGYDDAVLIELLRELAETDAELVGTGWDADALAALIAAQPREYRTSPDDVPEPPVEPVATPGSLWLLGRHRLLCGDATAGEDVRRVMGGQRARLLATDPPYLVDYDGGNHPQSKSNRAAVKDKPWDDYRDGDESLYTDFVNVAFAEAVEPDAPVYQWHADLRRRWVLDAWASAGLLVHQVIVWAKNRPVLTHSDFMWQHEPCVYGWRQGSRPDAQRRPPANEPTVWTADIQSSNDIHPTQKPVALFEPPMRWHLRPGEIAFEPFSGSGTTIVAAETTGRTCFAIEAAPQYVDVAAKRWSDMTGEPVLDADTGEAVSLDG